VSQYVVSEYAESDQARLIDEPEKRSGRTEFARDRARVLHSAALRRLAAKTQVVVPWESDFPRTRLSHSLECGQIGRELGAALGADPDLVETACLAHDLGHPPFGHNGETALAEASVGCGGFEGNAQSLRLLVRLEAKSLHADGGSAGLNLTRASLDAATKYPWGADLNPKKFGVYEDDREVFEWMRQGAPLGQRCLEAQIMDWSDDIAYSVHDLEDAIFAGSVDVKALHDPQERAALFALAQSEYAPDANFEEMDAALDRLQALPQWPENFDGSHAALAGLKGLTSKLVGRFCRAAEEATRAEFGQSRLIRYQAHLIVPREQRLECAVLKAMAALYVMKTTHAIARYSTQREVIAELVEALAQRAPESLDSLFAPMWKSAADDSARLRVVIDFVASLTDPGALALHQSLRS
jgi:dGTPase